MQMKVLLASAMTAALASAQSNATNTTLTSLIMGNTNLQGLGTILGAYPGIASALNNRTNVTLFAPSNAAIQALTGSSGASAMSQDAIAALLSYHVLNGTFYASNISTTPQFPHTNLNNATYSNVTGGQVVECLLSGGNATIISGLRSRVNVTQANLNFTGGVVHVIDGVLSIPGNVTSVATAANLTAFNGALQATNLTAPLDAARDVTIFAPSNSAFQAIGSALGNLTATQLAAIAEYHVINGSILYSSSLTNTTIPSMGGGNLTIRVENNAVFVDSARVINPDILIAGGVLHIIDSVLNPNNTNATANATASTASPAYSGASSATNVPLTSGQASPSSTNAALATTQSAVASGYSSVVAGGGASNTQAAHSSTSSAGAAMVTGAIGAAALFGGAAFMANL